jgi:alpha-amylase/alpha-mannosidase (GH57 family)
MKKNVDLIFLWHMHQPDYRDYASGDFVLPWTYLHAIKDYTDMAYHLEKHPGVHAVVNFVPILLDQLDDYTDQFASGQVRDPLLRLLIEKDFGNILPEQRKLALDACFRNNHTKMIAPYPAYKRLWELFNLVQAESETAISYLSGQYVADLLTWYHLAWCGESVRREHALVARLMAKAEGFNYSDRKQLFDLIGELIAGILPRYRKLADSGQVEISSTPHYHPIAPLLIRGSSVSWRIYARPSRVTAHVLVPIRRECGQLKDRFHLKHLKSSLQKDVSGLQAGKAC